MAKVDLDQAEATELMAKWPNLSRDERTKIWLDISDLTVEEFQAYQDNHKARQAGVPQPGSEAPDFEADVLDRERKRTGETWRLSSSRGKPEGLIFGSFT